MSIAVCLLMITSISTPFTQNVGQSQIIEQPTSSSSGTGGLADSPWPMLSFNAQRTGLSPYNTSANTGQLKWSFKTDGSVRSPVIGSDGTIYVASADEKLYAINPDGAEKWNFTIGGFMFLSPAIDTNGTIYAGCSNNSLFALNPDGSEKWHFITEGHVTSTPAIGSNGTIYFGTSSGINSYHLFYALNPNGTEKWRFQIDTGGQASSPGIGLDGTIYFGSSDYNLYALNPDGSEKWRFTAATDNVQSAPAIDSEGMIYVGSRDHNLYAIYPNGTEKWRFTTGASIGWDTSVAISSDCTIYVGSTDENLYAINSEGIEKWRFPANSLIQTAPAIGSEGTIYFGSDDNNLYAINPDGTEKWNFTTGWMVHSSPAIGSDGTIYIGSWDNNLYAIGGFAPNIIIEKTANVTVAKPGDLIEYNIYYNNTGPDDAGTVWINDTLPEGVTFVTSSAEGNRTGDYNWTFYNMPAKMPIWGGPYLPATRPSSFEEHDMAYDSTNNKVVLFGGLRNGTRLDETWEYDTSTHTWYGPYLPNPRPSPRVDHAMVYDSINNKVVLYGGWDGTGYGRDDTWEYDTATHTWSGPYFPSIRPPELYEHDMAYDSANNKVVLFGGFSCTGTRFDETWEYDTATHTWSGPYMPNPRPSPRHEHAMVYDSSNNKIVMYGGWDGSGATSDETWEYDTATHIWSGPYIPASHPTSFNEHDMAYDSTNSRVVLFGGFCSGVRLDETWEYETATHTCFGPIMPYPRPFPRHEHAMAYDSINNKVVLYGGWDSSGSTSDETWEYNHFQPNYFTITVQINSDVPNGTILTNYAHLDYTDSLGNLMLDSIDTAGVLVLAPENKPPIADAGSDQTVNENDVVQFDGRGSYDPDSNFSFGPDVRVNDIIDCVGSQSESVHPDIAVDDENNIYVVWRDYRELGPNIYFAKSTDNGVTFSKNIRINDEEGQNFSPSITVDEDGIIYIVWSDGRRGNLNDIYFTKSIDGGNTFLPNIRVDDAEMHHNNIYPSIIVNEGTINIVWSDDRNTPYYRDIYFSKSTDGGLTWSSNVRVDDSDDDSHILLYPNIDIDDGGNIYIVWMDRNESAFYFEASVFFTSSIDGGQTFNPSVQLNTHPDPTACYPDIAVDNDGRIYVVRSERFQMNLYDVLITTSTDKGASFGNETVVNSDVEGAHFLGWHSIEADRNNNIHVVWETDKISNEGIYYSLFTNGSSGFSKSYKVNDDFITLVMFPSIAVDNEGIPYIVWKGRSKEGWNIYLSKGDESPSRKLIYQWDFDTNVDSDGDGNPTNDVDATGPTPTYIYGDDGVYTVTLKVTDNQNLSTTDSCNVTVQNVDPTVSIKSISMNVEIGLRVAGRKYNNVSMVLYENGSLLGNVSIERMPGSPNEQMAWIPVSINFSKSYNATVFYTPEDPPNIGGNPVWIYIKSQNGSIKKIHHTFNIQQSKKRDSEHWNHIEPWEVDLNGYFIGLPFEIISHITDLGSDDETLTFTYGSQVKTVTYLNNPPNPDPYPSPEVNPSDITDTTTLIYEGAGTVTLVVKDDDNVRLGVGEGIDSKSVG